MLILVHKISRAAFPTARSTRARDVKVPMERYGISMGRRVERYDEPDAEGDGVGPELRGGEAAAAVDACCGVDVGVGLSSSAVGVSSYRTPGPKCGYVDKGCSISLGSIASLMLPRPLGYRISTSDSESLVSLTLFRESVS